MLRECNIKNYFVLLSKKTKHFIDAVANVSIDVVVVVVDDVIVVVDDAVVEPLKLQIDKIYDFRFVIVFFAAATSS